MERVLALNQELLISFASYLLKEDVLSLLLANKQCHAILSSGIALGLIPSAVSKPTNTSRYSKYNSYNDWDDLYGIKREPSRPPPPKDFSTLLAEARSKEKEMLLFAKSDPSGAWSMVDALVLSKIGVMDLPTLYLSDLGGSCLIDYFVQRDLPLYYRHYFPLQVLYQCSESVAGSGSNGSGSSGDGGTGEIEYTFNFDPFRELKDGFIILCRYGNHWSFNYQE